MPTNNPHTRPLRRLAPEPRRRGPARKAASHDSSSAGGRVPGPAVPGKGRPLLSGTAIQALREPGVLMALTYGVTGVLILGMLARICRKGPDAADGSGNGADGAKTPAAG